MTRDEFRKKLATAEGRAELKIVLTAVQAAQAIADDETLDLMYEALLSGEAVSVVPKNRSRQKFMKPRFLIPAAVAIVLCAGGAVAAILWVAAPTHSAVSSSADVSFTARGTLSIHNGGVNNPCFASQGLEDVQEGSKVVVSSASGATLAIGSLSNPVHNTWGKCVLNWSVTGIPGGGKFYGVEVGHRGVVKYSEADLLGGKNSLSIG